MPVPGMGNGEKDNARRDAGLEVGGTVDPRVTIDLGGRATNIMSGDVLTLENGELVRVGKPEDYELGVPEYRRPRIDFDRHPNSARFHELLQQAGDLHDRKQADYGRDQDPFANVRASEEWGIDGWVGAMVRLNDKVRRLQSFATKGSLANEGVLDSFMDIAVYALIAHVLYEEEVQA